MNDDQLLSALSQMEEVRASPGFTEETHRRLAATRSIPQWRPLLVAAAAALVLVIGATAVWRQAERASQRRAGLAELRVLQQEYSRLTEALTTKGRRPEYLYLGGTDQAEYVVDLSKVSQESASQGSAFIPTRLTRF